MSSSKWKPSKGAWGIFGSHGGSEYGSERRTHAKRNASLAGGLNTALGQMGKQMKALDTHTAGEKERAESGFDRAQGKDDRAGAALGRAGGAFNRAGQAKQMGDAKAGLMLSNSGTAAGLASAQTGMAGKAAASKSSQAANQMAAASGMQSMGQVQVQHEEALNNAYQQSAISNTQAGMAQRTSQFGAAETAFGAQQAYANAGDAFANAGDVRANATDALGQASDTRDAQVGQATLNQANALASMAKDISSMTTSYQQATEETFSSAELDALTSDLG